MGVRLAREGFVPERLGLASRSLVLGNNRSGFS